LADAHGIAVAVRVQGGKFYFTVTGTLAKCTRFMNASFPGAWMTSGAGPDATYGLPPDEVARVLAELEMDPDWLGHHDEAPLRIAQHIREAGDFQLLPVLADALEEGGCSNAAILSHCRAWAAHAHTCWVIDLLLGPDRKRNQSEIRMRAVMEFAAELQRNFEKAHH